MAKKGKKEKAEKSPEQNEPHVPISGRQKIISWAVFIPTLITVFISLISAVFPALVTRVTSPLQNSIYKPDIINPFQFGILAVPLIVVNVIILVIGITYYKGSIDRKFFRSITNFNLSRKRSLIILGIILIVFAGATAGQLGTEETWDDYKDVKKLAKSFAISDFAQGVQPHLKFLLLSVSLNIFGNIRVIPFIASIILLALTYFFTSEITQNRFAGIVSTLLLVQSGVFLSYSTSATYDNFWILLYLFSLYLIHKKWPPSAISYILSIFAKSLTLSFLPMSLFFISRSNITRKAILYSLASYGGVILMAIGISLAFRTNFAYSTFGFDVVDFWKGFTDMAFQMRFDYVLVLFLLPLVVMLFFASRKGIIHADSIQIFFLTVLLTTPFLIGFTTQTNQPYRFVSLSLFFAIGVGVLLSKRTRTKVELSST